MYPDNDPDNLMGSKLDQDPSSEIFFVMSSNQYKQTDKQS